MSLEMIRPGWQHRRCAKFARSLLSMSSFPRHHLLMSSFALNTRPRSFSKFSSFPAAAIPLRSLDPQGSDEWWLRKS